VITLWAIALVVVAVVFRDRIFPSDTPAPIPQTTQPAVATRPVATRPAPVSLDRLVGRWQRKTGGYVLHIKKVHEDGTLDAAYLNPQPVNVARAQTMEQNGLLIVLVMLKDRGYPGNTYTLTYDAAADELTGVYRHRGMGREFDVTFSRIDPAAGE
jgi:hypothetical protein